jgi:hypothetical protein
MPGNLTKLAGGASLGFILCSNSGIPAALSAAKPSNAKHKQKITARQPATRNAID